MSRDSYFVICNALADPGTLVLGDARSFLNENAKNLSRAIQNSGDFECACLANIIPIFQVSHDYHILAIAKYRSHPSGLSVMC